MSAPVYLLELTAKAWPQFLRSGTPNANGTRIDGQTRLPVNPAKTYTVTGIARRSASADGYLYLGVRLFDAAGDNITGDGTYWFYAATFVVPGTGWTTYTGTFGSGTAKTFPGGAATMTPLVLLNNASSAGTMDVAELWIQDDAAAGVAITQDRYMRNAEEWRAFLGTAYVQHTQVGGTPETVTRRFATRAYMTQPSDTPPKVQYDARVRQPGLLRMELPQGPGGSITTSYGQIVLDNSDGALGDMAYLGLDGQPFSLRYGQADGAYSSFTEIMRGTMQQAVVDRSQVIIRLAGRDAIFDQPLARGRYLGNNALPAGLEGSSDLAGQAKPMLYGQAFGIQPPCVNTSRYIYQVSAGATGAATTNVWVAGVALTGGSNYSSQADMETNAPSAGTFRAWPAGGYFRLGTAPAGVVTATGDATETSYGSGDWWWKALYRMAVDAGVGSGEIQHAISNSFAQPDNWGGGSWPTDQPAIGVWINDARTTIRQAMNQVASSVGAWFGFVHWGGSPGAVMKLGGDIYPPSSAGVYPAGYPNFDASQLLAVAGIADPGDGRGVPAWSVELGYAPNYTVLSPSQAPSLSPLALGRLDIKSLRAVQSDATVQDKHASARAVVRETVFVDNPTGVAHEARRQLELLRSTKQWLEVRASLRAVLDQAYRPRLGGYVFITWPTLKVLWQDGVMRDNGWFTVQALEIDFARNEVRMTLRQATEQSI